MFYNQLNREGHFFHLITCIIANLTHANSVLNFQGKSLKSKFYFISKILSIQKICYVNMIKNLMSNENE